MKAVASVFHSTLNVQYKASDILHAREAATFNVKLETRYI